MFYKYCGDIHLPYHISLHFLPFLLLFIFLIMTMTFLRNCGIYCCLVLIYVCSVLFFQFCTNYFVHFCFVTVGFPLPLPFFGYFNKLVINFVPLIFTFKYIQVSQSCEKVHNLFVIKLSTFTFFLDDNCVKHSGIEQRQSF
jgi:hypothetical protein